MLGTHQFWLFGHAGNMLVPLNLRNHRGKGMFPRENQGTTDRKGMDTKQTKVVTGFFAQTYSDMQCFWSLS